jgi:hypothetical protein
MNKKFIVLNELKFLKSYQFRMKIDIIPEFINLHEYSFLILIF